VAAIASYLDAKAHHGQWLVRIEDVDGARNVHGADDHILASLQRCGMHWDGEVTVANQALRAVPARAGTARRSGLPCGCSRREIADSQVNQVTHHNQALIYPGTCRNGLAPGKVGRALRVKVPLSPHCVPRLKTAGPATTART
jgi:glutamyl-Q tRNA(Asp) synthetase